MQAGGDLAVAPPQPEIVLAEDGAHSAVTPEGLTVGLVAGEGGRLVKRRAIHRFGTPGAFQSVMLVAELDGVRVYIRGHDIIVTRQNLYPQAG